MESFRVLEDLRAGMSLSHESILDYVLEVHSRHPGFTETLIADVSTEAGLTSYETLLNAVELPPAGKFLDLACGSGWLVESLLDRIDSTGSVVGVDISKAELALARQRTHAPNLIYAQGSAQQIPAADRSFDLVYCHLALMVMQPLNPVIREVHRVLKVGGRFAFMLEGLGHHPPLYQDFSDRVADLIRAELPHFSAGLADPRLLSEAGLLQLIEGTFGADGLIVREDVLLQLRGTPVAVAETLIQFFYCTYVLSKPTRAALLAETTSMIASGADSHSDVIVEVPQTCLVVEKRQKSN